MEKAKQLAKDYQKEIKSERTELHMNGLKPEINNLLHTYLPDDLTIKEVEILAMVMNEMIWNPYQFVRDENQPTNDKA